MSVFRTAFCLAVACTVIIPRVAWSATDPELAQMREEIRVLRAQYEARIRALEQKLETLQPLPASAATPRSLKEEGPRASVDSGSGVPGNEATVTPPANISSGPAASGIAAFNPAISVVLQGTYANLSRDPQRYSLAGFQKADEVSPGRRGLGVGESELTMSANVDDRFAGNLIVSLTPDNRVSIEEAYGFMPSLSNGLVPKFGRFLSGVGYLNEQHQHAWDFVDAPLAYQALLGGQFAQDGAQLKWIAPTDQFLEFGAEIGNGDSFPGSFRNRNGAGALALFGHTGGDIGASHSWRAGVSYLETRAADRAATVLGPTRDLVDVGFSGTSRLVIADFVWKYAPNGNSRERNFKLQGEYLWRRERGDVTVDTAATGAQPAPFASRQSGWYMQGTYQFQPYWRVGARYDRLDPGTPRYAGNADLLDMSTFRSNRAAVMLDYTPSEFTRFRLQYADSKTRGDASDRQLYLQYILTLGAHGAHRF
ncbi:MAG: OprO/OprP family phosphate-selective porin [Pseudomonadota bacterium]|nr:OprO/OprP family phosphate-selective porin [Pseudomonadota bacterium]